MWLDSKGSNPHSNGEVFSREKINFFEIIKLVISKIQEKVSTKKIGIRIIIIIYIKFFKYFNWKLNVIFYTI